MVMFMGILPPLADEFDHFTIDWDQVGQLSPLRVSSKESTYHVQPDDKAETEYSSKLKARDFHQLQNQNVSSNFIQKVM